MTGKAAPDSFISVAYKGKMYGGVQKFSKNEYILRWSLKVPIVSTRLNQHEILRIYVTDKDLRNHDNIGELLISVKDITSKKGLVEHNLLPERKRFKDGLVDLKYIIKC